MAIRIHSVNFDIPENLPRPNRCAPERVDSKRVTINGKRVTLHLCAYGWESRHAWGHAAFCPELGTTEKYVYYNRTWEANRFDSVLRGLFEKCLLCDNKRRAAKNREDRARRKEARRRREERAARLAVIKASLKAQGLPCERWNCEREYSKQFPNG